MEKNKQINIHYTENDIRAIRLAKIIVDVGTDVLRRCLMSVMKKKKYSTLQQFLEDKEVKKYFKKQYYCDSLYTSNGIATKNTDTFDITLYNAVFSKLLNETNDVDIEIMNRIKEIKDIRNNNYAHILKIGLSETEFKDILAQIKIALNKLCELTNIKYVDQEIKLLLQNPINEEITKYKNLMLEMFVKDNEFKELFFKELKNLTTNEELLSLIQDLNLSFNEMIVKIDHIFQKLDKNELQKVMQNVSNKLDEIYEQLKHFKAAPTNHKYDSSENQEWKLPESNLAEPIQNFVGREQVLKQINDSFFVDKKQTIILSSLAGTGKTTVANKIGNMFKEKDSNNYVYWMNSEENKLDLEWKYFASDLKIKCDPHCLTREDLLIKILNEINKPNNKILFVFDNCDSSENLEFYVKKLSLLKNIYILVTTQIEDFKSHLISYTFEAIKLEPFDYQESIEFMKINLANKFENEEQVKELYNLLNYTNDKIGPYKLNKTLSIVKLKIGKHKGINSIIDEIKQSKNKELINKIVEGDQLFEMLYKNERQAFEILKLCSLLDPDFIPHEIFTEIFLFNEKDLNKSVETLKTLSLIDLDAKNGFGIKIHETLQEETQKYLNSKNELEYLINNCTDKLLYVLKNENMIKRYFRKNKFYYNFKKIIDHIVKICVIPKKEQAEIIMFFGLFTSDCQSNYQEALKYYDNSLAIYRELYENDDNLDIVRNFKNIGSCFQQQGNIDEALKFYNKSLYTMRKIYKNDDNLEIAEIINCIGSCHQEQGKTEKALQFYNDSLLIKRKVYKNDDNLEIAGTLNCIGSCHLERGKLVEALKFYNDSLSIKRKIYKTDDNLEIADTLIKIDDCENKAKKYNAVFLLKRKRA